MSVVDETVIKHEQTNGNECKTSVDASAEVTERQSRKRPAETEADVKERRLKRLREHLITGDMNAVMMLNEYHKDAKYELVEQVGPSHSPSFTYHLTVDGQRFMGVSSSKKKAKLFAAECAIQTLYRDLSQLGAADIAIASVSQRSVGTNPTVLLNRLHLLAHYELETKVEPSQVTDAANAKELYHFKCFLSGQCFEGQGLTKKIAKARAAQAALHHLFGIECTEESDGMPVYIGDCDALKDKIGVSSVKPDVAPPVDIPLPALVAVLPDGKNPMSLLNELYLGCEVKSDEPTADKPGVFAARVTLEDQEFVGHGKTKKIARMSAATIAVNYLYQTGLLHVRLAEKASKRHEQKPTWPRPRAQFSQESNQPSTRGTGRGRGFSHGGTDQGLRGSRGRGRGSRGVSQSSLKTSYTAEGSGRAGWIPGGILKAGDFLGLNNAQFGSQTDTANYNNYGSHYPYEAPNNHSGQYGNFNAGSQQTSVSWGMGNSTRGATRGAASSTMRGTTSNTMRGAMRGATRGVSVASRGALSASRGSATVGGRGRGTNGSKSTSSRVLSFVPSAAAMYTLNAASGVSTTSSVTSAANQNSAPWTDSTSAGAAYNPGSEFVDSTAATAGGQSYSSYSQYEYDSYGQAYNYEQPYASTDVNYYSGTDYVQFDGKSDANNMYEQF